MKTLLKRIAIIGAAILAVMFLFNIIQFFGKPVSNVTRFPGTDGIASIIGVAGVVQASDGAVVNTRVIINLVFLGLSTDLGYGIRAHLTVLPIVGHFLALYNVGARWWMMLNNIGVGVGLLGGS